MWRSARISVSGRGLRRLSDEFGRRSAAVRLVRSVRQGNQSKLGENRGDSALSSPSLSPDGQHVAMYRSVNAGIPTSGCSKRNGVCLAGSRLTSADDVSPIGLPMVTGSSSIRTAGGTSTFIRSRSLGAGVRNCYCRHAEPKFVNGLVARRALRALSAVGIPKKATDIWALPLGR